MIYLIVVLLCDSRPKKFESINGGGGVLVDNTLLCRAVCGAPSCAPASAMRTDLGVWDNEKGWVQPASPPVTPPAQSLSSTADPMDAPVEFEESSTAVRARLLRLLEHRTPPELELPSSKRRRQFELELADPMQVVLVNDEGDCSLSTADGAMIESMAVEEAHTPAADERLLAVLLGARAYNAYTSRMFPCGRLEAVRAAALARGAIAA